MQGALRWPSILYALAAVAANPQAWRSDHEQVLFLGYSSGDTMDRLFSILGIVGLLTLLALSLVYLAAGLAGIEHSLGAWWALGALIAAMFRFTWPITIGAFFCAMNVWGWHWTLATLFAAPGLAFIIPAVLGYVFALVKR